MAGGLGRVFWTVWAFSGAIFCVVGAVLSLADVTFLEKDMIFVCFLVFFVLLCSV